MRASVQIYKMIRGESKLTEFPIIEKDQHIFITPKDIVPKLQMYIDGNVSSDELVQWSSMILHQDCIVVKGWEDDQIADHYEPMWYILQQISAPFIDGPITKMRAQDYINKLAELYMLLKPLRSLRSLHSDTLLQVPFAIGFANLSQTCPSTMCRLTRCYTS